MRYFDTIIASLFVKIKRFGLFVGKKRGRRAFPVISPAGTGFFHVKGAFPGKKFMQKATHPALLL